jgi:hypothetical protein
LKKSQSAKNFVGSANSVNINYHRDTHAFDSSLIPDKSRKAAEDMKYLVSKDILSLKAPEWNKSTFVDNMKYVHDLNQPAQYKWRLRNLPEIEEKLPSKKNYEGTDSRNSLKGWNVSTFVEKKDLRKRLEKL